MSLEHISTPQPHYIPGYTGYCPQVTYCVGDTFGHATHKLLLDPKVGHAERLVLSDRTADSYQVARPPKTKLETIEARQRYVDAVFRHPMTPGYEGHLPRLTGTCGQTFSVAAAEALDSFGQLQINRKLALNAIDRQTLLQNARYRPKNVDERQLITTQYSTPLHEISAEYAQVLRSVIKDEPPIEPPYESIDPYCPELQDVDKSPRTGYAGHVPFAYGEFGKTQDLVIRSALAKFALSTRNHLSTEFCPVHLTQPDPPMEIPPTEIYFKHTGQLPNYAGHVPGYKYKCGKTFTNSTVDAKRWLRGDFSP